MQFKCDCQTVTGTGNSWKSVLNQFENVRKNCPALREIFVPESVWPQFSEVALNFHNNATEHQYIFLCAFKAGFLRKITLPVHAYLLDGEKPKKSLKKQYKQDLIEKWILKKIPTERHIGARGFHGKLAELISSSWIESQGWKIINLEALGGSFDIEAISPQGKCCAIEVKYIGEQNHQYEQSLESLKSGRAVYGGINHYDRYNYILLRIYEATKQLSSFKGDRYVFIVISNLIWHVIDIAIQDNWLQQYPSKFFNLLPLEWKSLRKKYPNIDTEIGEILNQIKELWIIKDDSLKYSLRKIIKLES